MKQKIHHMFKIAIPKLPFIDKKQTQEFYLDQLGFRLLSDYHDYFLIKRDNAELHFFSYPDLNPDKSDFMIYIRIDDDIESLYSHIQKFNTVPKKLYPFEIKPWGQKEFAVIDPNGTLLTFGQPST